MSESVPLTSPSPPPPRLCKLEPGAYIQGYPVLVKMAETASTPWPALILRSHDGHIIVPIVGALRDALDRLNRVKGFWGETPWIGIQVLDRIPIGNSGRFLVAVDVQAFDDEPQLHALANVGGVPVIRPRPWRGLDMSNLGEAPLPVRVKGLLEA